LENGKVLKILKTFVKTKNKTSLFVLEALRDEDFGLEDCITAEVVIEICQLECYSKTYISHFISRSFLFQCTFCKFL